MSDPKTNEDKRLAVSKAQVRAVRALDELWEVDDEGLNGAERGLLAQARERLNVLNEALLKRLHELQKGANG